MFWRSRNPPRRPRPSRFARLLRNLATDEDSYVFLGVGLVALGVGAIEGLAYGLAAGGGLLFAFGLWLGFWRLSAREGER